MSMKDFVVPLLLAMATTWAIQYFFFGKKSEDPYRFTAPQSAVECRPLNKEIQRTPEKRPCHDTITTVQTTWGSCELSSCGAVLTRLEFHRVIDGTPQVLTTIFPAAAESKDPQAFMVALDTVSPYQYELVKRTESDATTTVMFEARAHEGIIRKSFAVYKNVNKVDVSLELIPDAGKSMRARLFYPAPLMPGLKDDVISADVIDGSGSFAKTARDSIKLDEGWIKTSLFGVENKYFIHAMVKDDNSFAQRAYFDYASDKSLIAIVEGPAVEAATTWNLSFYLGPKEAHALEAVDKRLEQALDYSGILSPISRILLFALNWLYDIFHNYGIAIIVLSVLIKILLLPLGVSAERSMKGRTEMQKRLAYIQQKYKDDPQARAQAQAEFMQKHGLGLMGCLPMLLQIPIFFGLSRVLSSSIELYKAPFLWMTDLSARDPYYILPFLVVLGMLSSAFSVSDAKQRIPVIAMAVAFGAVSTTMASGLVMYIAISTLLNMVQTRIFSWLRLA